ncbi:MAG: phosphoesterase, partial [Planctomycetes bacterium]|nr:phosphoesterase [Planctomycetota bacterium]
SWRVLHGDRTTPPGSVVLGHFHPCLRWRGITAPCFLTGKDRLLLPAFSTDAAGVNVLHNPRWQRDRCQVIAGDEVLDLGVLGRLNARRREKERRPK